MIKRLSFVYFLTAYLPPPRHHFYEQLSTLNGIAYSTWNNRPLFNAKHHGKAASERWKRHQEARLHQLWRVYSYSDIFGRKSIGLFSAYALNVTFLQIPNSTFGYASLLDGTYDVLTGTVDNAINLRFNLNKSLTLTGQLDGGPDLAIATISSITDINQLKGKSLMVDSPVSGFAFILRKVLGLFGLLLENSDYSFQVIGSTNTRFADLINGTLRNGTATFGTILTYPFTGEDETLSTNVQANIVARFSDFIQLLTSSVTAVREVSLSDETMFGLLTNFQAAMLDANMFLANPLNKKCSVLAISKDLNVTLDTAQLEYKAAVNPLTGETSSVGGNFTISRQGILNVIDIRNQFGGFSGTPSGFDFVDAVTPGSGKLIDYGLRDAAVKALRSHQPASCRNRGRQ